MKPEQALAIADALSLCKRLLWDGKGGVQPEDKEYAICFCLEKVAHPGSEPARNLIMRRLRGEMTLNGWLRAQGIPRWEITNERIQAHRLAWVNLLINEFKEKANAAR